MEITRVGPAGAPSSGLHLAIGTLKIREGTLSYTNPKTGQTLKAENLEALASVVMRTIR